MIERRAVRTCTKSKHPSVVVRESKHLLAVGVCQGGAQVPPAEEP